MIAVVTLPPYTNHESIIAYLVRSKVKVTCGFKDRYLSTGKGVKALVLDVEHDDSKVLAGLIEKSLKGKRYYSIVAYNNYSSFISVPKEEEKESE